MCSPREPTSEDRPVGQYLDAIGPGRARLRIGLPHDFFYASLDPDIQAATDQALRTLVALGAELRETPLEVSTDRIVIRAEAYAYHAEYVAKSPELYIPETLAKVRLGAGIDAQTYIRARRDLDRLRRTSLTVFSSVDLLVTPTTPVIAPKASDYPSTIEGALALDGSLLRNTRPLNLLAFPTISVPCGLTNAGMPIGLQISGPPWEESRVLGLAHAYQEATDWHRRRPPTLTRS